MAKRNSDGDVLFNRLNVALGRHQRTLASMLGPKKEPTKEKLEREQEREDLEDEAVGPEQIGLGGKIPRNNKDSNIFTQRGLTSDDKLLQKLIGSKKAKAHIASKQQNGQKNATPIRFDKPQKTPKPVESEDEDGGRTSVFKSKKQRTRKPNPVTTDPDVLEAQEDLPEIGLPHRLASTDGNSEDPMLDSEPATVRKGNREKDDSDAEVATSRKQKSTKGSYLDEILAERSKKKKKKKKKKSINQE